MSEELQSGDFLIFQIEAGYGLLRLLDKTPSNDGNIWHLAAYADMFLDIDSAEEAISNHAELTISHPLISITNRAFESTQTARMGNRPLSSKELEPLKAWKADPASEVSDRSVRLLLGLR